MFSRYSPCLHSWGYMREDWSVAGRVFSSFSWLLIYGLGEHISVVEREFLAEEGVLTDLHQVFCECSVKFKSTFR